MRKRAPTLETPFKVLLYCTIPNPKDTKDLLEIHGADGKIRKANGKLCGEAWCYEIVEVKPPFKEKYDGTCLTAKQLYEYMGTNDKLYFMKLEHPFAYEDPYSLEEIGVKRAPQSWQYLNYHTVRALALASRHVDEIFAEAEAVRKGECE